MITLLCAAHTLALTPIVAALCGRADCPTTTVYRAGRGMVTRCACDTM